MTTIYRRNRITPWKMLKRCVVFFTTLCVVPVLLVFMVTTDQYMRPLRASRGLVKLEPDGTTIDDGPTLKVELNMSVIAERMDARRQFLQKACHRLGLDIVGNDTLHKPNSWEFLVDRKHHLVWCNVFKAASSSWMYNFNLLAGYSPNFLRKSKQVPLHLARKKYPRPSLSQLKYALNDSVSFLIVRHPLERLLSAYRDKLQHALPNTLHQKLGYQIIVKYRKNAGQNKVHSPRWPKFPEFVQYLLDSVKNGLDMDMHWTPITTFCTPCQFNFDVIAKIESLQEDQTYLIQKAGLQDIIKPEWRNPGHGRATADQVIEYYSQVTKDQVLQLYQIYKYDFELFNYSLDGYLDVAQPPQDKSSMIDYQIT